MRNCSIDHQLDDLAVVSTTWRYWSDTAGKLTVSGLAVPVQPLATLVHVVPLEETSTL